MSAPTTLTVELLQDDPRRKRDTTEKEKLTKGEYHFTNVSQAQVDAITAPADRKRKEKLEFRVPIAFVQSSAERMEYKETLVKELFLFIPFFLMYVFLVVVEGSVEQTYFISWSLGSRLYFQDIPPASRVTGPTFGRTFHEITDPEDFYLWASGTYVDLHYTRPNEDERQLDGPNYVGGPNIQFGAARFRVQRMGDRSCSLDDRWLPLNDTYFPQDCYAPHDSSKLNTSTFGPPGREDLFPYESGCFAGYVVGDMARYDCSGNYFDVSLNFSKNEAIQTIQQMNPTTGFAGFFDPLEARFVSLSFFSYNPAVDHFGLTTAWFEHSASGTYIPGWRTVHFRVYSAKWLDRGIFSIFFAVAVFLHLVAYIMVLRTAFKRGKFLERFLQVWSLLDIANIISLAVFFGFRFTWWSVSQDTDFKMTTEGVYDNDMEDISVLYDAQTFSATISTLIIFLRLLKFNMLSSRLGVINRTLDSAAQNLVNLLAIFLMVVLSYAVMATALFGSGMRDFYNYENAIASLLRMLIGDFDYDGLKEEQWYLAALFFWSFIILGLFLLLNMMIAVIGDAFEQEQNAAAGVPIADEIAEFFRSSWRTIKRVVGNPKAAVSDAVEASQRGLQNQGKYGIIEEVAREYRHSLPCEHVTVEQFLLLNEEERALVLPNPKINRKDLETIFCSDELGRDKYQFLRPEFIDDFWLDLVAEYRFFRDEKEIQKVAKRKARIKVAGITALRDILNPEPENDAEEDAAIASRRAGELFSLTVEGLENLHSIDTRLKTIEEKTQMLGHVVSRLDAVKLSGSHVGEAGDVQRAADSSDAKAVAGYSRYLRMTTAPLPTI